MRKTTKLLVSILAVILPAAIYAAVNSQASTISQDQFAKYTTQIEHHKGCLEILDKAAEYHNQQVPLNTNVVLYYIPMYCLNDYYASAALGRADIRYSFMKDSEINGFILGKHVSKNNYIYRKNHKIYKKRKSNDNKAHKKTFLKLPNRLTADTYLHAKSEISYIPKLYLSGYAGNSVLGQVDVLAPVYLHNDKNAFIYAQGRYAYNYDNNKWDDDSSTSSLGAVYRQIVNNSFVLGGYMLAEYGETPNSHHLWMLSPGVEALGKIWNFRANGYFPVSKRSWKNNDNIVRYEEVGLGGDAEVGRKVFDLGYIPVKLYVNSYYFNMPHIKDVLGIGGRLELPVTNSINISISDSYDGNQHNVVMVGARFLINNIYKDFSLKVDQDLHSRLDDPIIRNLGSLGIGSVQAKEK